MQLISSGELRDLAVGRSGGRVRRVSMSSGFGLSYAQIWRSQPALRIVVDFLARNVSMIGFRAFEVETRAKLDRSHPVRRWCYQPSPDIGSVAYVGRVVSDLAIFDRHLSLLHRSPDGRIWTQPVQPARWQPHEGTWMGPTSFAVDLGGERRVFGQHEVIHIAGYDPDEIGVGCSPIESLRQTLLADAAAEKARQLSWERGARPSVVLSRPVDAPDWSTEARDRFLDEWDDAYSAGGYREGQTAMLEDGMTLKEVERTARDSQYIETRRLTREECAAAYQVAPPLVGILDHATFSNIAEQHKSLLVDTLGWWFRRLEQVYQLQLVERHADPRVVLDFDEWSRVRGSAEEAARTIATGTGGPVMTRNEGRERMGLAPIEGADDLIVPLNVLTGGQAAPTIPTDVPAPKALPAGPLVKATIDPQPDDVAGLLLSHLARQRRATVARLGKADSSGLAYDVDRWNAELAADLKRLLPLHALGALAAAGLSATPSTAVTVAAAAETWASVINGSTSAHIGDALTGRVDRTVHEVFDARVSEAPDIARSVVSDTANEAVERVVQEAQAVDPDDPSRPVKTWRKRWHTTSANPRSSHARMNGVSVEVGEKFPNGQRWPGDRSEGSQGDLGCRCVMEVFEQ